MGIYHSFAAVLFIHLIRQYLKSPLYNHKENASLTKLISSLELLRKSKWDQIKSKSQKPTTLFWAWLGFSFWFSWTSKRTKLGKSLSPTASVSLVIDLHRSLSLYHFQAALAKLLQDTRG